MSERRKARAATVSAPHGGIPEPLLSRLHPIWKDPDRVRAAFPEYVHPTDFTPLSFRRLYGSLVIRWALANGYESEQYRGSADWHRLRAADASQRIRGTAPTRSRWPGPSGSPVSRKGGGNSTV